MPNLKAPRHSPASISRARRAAANLSSGPGAAGLEELAIKDGELSAAREELAIKESELGAARQELAVMDSELGATREELAKGCQLAAARQVLAAAQVLGKRPFQPADRDAQRIKDLEDDLFCQREFATVSLPL